MYAVQKRIILFFFILLANKDGFSQLYIYPNPVSIILAITAKRAVPLNSVMETKVYSEEERKNRKKILNRQYDSLRREIALHPKDPEPLFQRGLIREEFGAYADAKADFDQAIFLGKRTKALYMALAKTCDRAGAITCYTIVLKNDSSNLAALLGRGITKLYRKKSRYQTLKERCIESIPDFTLAIKYNPQFIEALILRGYANYILKNYGAAISDLKHVTEIDERKEIAWTFLGKAYIDNDQRAEACSTFTTAKKNGFEITDKLFLEACGK